MTLAIQAEELGYNLVVLGGSDEGLEPWSLTTWAGARTTRMRVGARLQQDTWPAATMARAAGSLQLLSDERATLILQTGSAPDDLQALAEALAVMTAMQDTSRDQVSRPGDHHHVAGAEPGPVANRAIPLWLSGSAPAIAELAGRLADGWVVDLDTVGAGGFAKLGTVVDAAAQAAGRDAREIERVVTVNHDGAHVAALVGLPVDHGVRQFVVRVDASADGRERLASFIHEIAPAVRKGAELALPPAVLSRSRPRRADVRAKRRPGIGYDEVPASLVDRAIEPGDPGFARVRSTYLRGGDPGLVLRPRTPEEVASAVAFARKHRSLPLGIRSGGHGISGRSTNDGGLVIDFGAMNTIDVLDESSRRVRIGPGARWRAVASALHPYGWALSSGDYGGVGVGGLATTGGIGYLNRKHGLTIDSLRAIEMVLADGSLVRASDTENVQLFWAARGAGANFGVAVAFEFEVDEVENVGWAQLAFEVPDPAVYLEDFGRVVQATPRETTPFLIVGRGMAQMMAMVDSQDPDVIVGQLQPFAEIAPLVQQQVVIAPYAAVMNMFPESPHNGRGEPVSRSVFTREITPGFASASADLIHSKASYWYQIRSVGGAVADVPADATAYAHRDANFSLTVMGANAQRVDRWFDPIRRESDGLYLSFESDSRPERIDDAFPPATRDRLRQLKTQIDPENLFRDNFNIAPHPVENRDPGAGRES